MSRWLLALLFAFGTVTFLTGCPAEEEKAGDDAKEAVEGAAEEAGEAAEEAGEAVEEAAE